MGSLFSKKPKPNDTSSGLDKNPFQYGEMKNQIVSQIMNDLIEDVIMKIEIKDCMNNYLECIEMNIHDMDAFDINEEIESEVKEVKLELIVKPCQSGKTFVMIEELIENFVEHTTSNWIHVIFTDNSILQTEQLQRRLDQNEDLDLCIENEISNSVVLSSNSKIKNTSSLLQAIERDHHRNVITLSNRIRILQICEIMEYFSDWTFSIWIDEADKTFTSDENIEQIHHWKLRSNVDKITFITATPSKLFEKYNDIYVYPLYKTFHPDQYNSISDCEIMIENQDSSNTLLYIESILQKNKDILKRGQCWFIPGDFRKKSHEDIRDKLNAKGFTVILINGDQKCVYLTNYENKRVMKRIFIHDSIQKPEELAILCGNIYEKYKLADQVVAITGNMCISRGITISSQKMMITHAILPPDISDKCNAYQLAGRLCGNIRMFENFQTPIIFMTENICKNICKMEKRAMNFAKIAYRENSSESSILSKVLYNKSFLSRVFRFYYVEFEKGEESKLEEYKRQNRFTNRSLDTREMDETGRFYLSSVTSRLKILSYDEIIRAIQYDGYSRLDIKEEKISKYSIGKKISRLYIGYKDTQNPDTIVYLLFIGEVIDIL